MKATTVESLAEDMVKIFGPPRWKFWQRKHTKAEAIEAIKYALAGDSEPIKTFGVLIAPDSPSPLKRIARQIELMSGRFR